MSNDIVTQLRMQAELTDAFPTMKAKDVAPTTWLNDAADEIERLRALSIELINSITEMAELGLLPKMTVRMNEAGKALSGAVHRD